jgi:ADP-ribosylglycohydrolase
MDRDELADRIFAIVIGAGVGDAMGAPTEGLEAGEIERRYDWVADFTGTGTDDSLMASLLADALVGSGGRAGADEWAEQLVAGRELIYAQRQKFFPSVLHLVEKLRSGVSPRAAALGNMASSSSAMCIGPVGAINAGQPGRAAQQAYRLAGLIHGQPVDFCQDGAAFVAATIAAGLRDGSAIEEACAEGLMHLDAASGEVMRTAIAAVIELAGRTAGYRDFRDRDHLLERPEVTRFNTAPRRPPAIAATMPSPPLPGGARRCPGAGPPSNNPRKPPTPSPPLPGGARRCLD